MTCDAKCVKIIMVEVIDIITLRWKKNIFEREVDGIINTGTQGDF